MILDEIARDSIRRRIIRRMLQQTNSWSESVTMAFLAYSVCAYALFSHGVEITVPQKFLLFKASRLGLV